MRPPRPATLRDAALCALTLAALAWLVLRGAERTGYNWPWGRVWGYVARLDEGRLIAGPLLQGLWVTLEITALGMVFAGLFGLIAALLRLSPSPLGRGLARLYLELIRNTPLLVQIFCLYFIFAPILGMGRMTTAVLALAAFEGAYVSEIFRAGILAVPKGQWEAGFALGLTTAQTLARVILPQALRIVAPPLTSQAVSLVKDSALVSTIAVYELTMQGRAIIADTYLSFEIWAVVAALYLLVTLTLSALSGWVKRRCAPGRRRGS